MQEEEEEVGDEEESGSDMDNFIVEDSQSQELVSDVNSIKNHESW